AAAAVGGGARIVAGRRVGCGLRGGGRAPDVVGLAGVRGRTGFARGRAVGARLDLDLERLLVDAGFVLEADRQRVTAGRRRRPRDRARGRIHAGAGWTVDEAPPRRRVAGAGGEVGERLVELGDRRRLGVDVRQP